MCRYFEGAEIGLALGLNLCIARMGSSVNGLLTPRISQLTGGTPIVPLFVGFGVCIFSGMCNALSVARESMKKDGQNDEISLKAIQKLGKHYWLLTGLCVLMYGAILPFNTIAQQLFTATYL